MSSKNLHVISTSPGRLGNRLVHYAHHLAYAKEHNIPLIHLGFSEYSSFFKGTKEYSLPIFIPDNFKDSDKVIDRFLHLLRQVFELAAKKGGLNLGIQQEEFIKLLNLEILKIKNNDFKIAVQKLCYNFPLLIEQGIVVDDNIFVLRGDDLQEKNLLLHPIVDASDESSKMILFDSWFDRCESLLQKHKSFIKDYFCLEDTLNELVCNYSKKIKKDNSIIVGLHIRRTDYNTFENGNYFFSIERYAEFTKALLKNVNGKNIRFYICSDEQLDLSKFTEIDYELGPGEAILDMYGFMLCDLIVGVPSTFTGWISFLSDTPLFSLLKDDDLTHPLKIAEFIST